MSNEPNHDIDENIRLIGIVRQALENDSELREKYSTGDKFRFVRERLQNLLKHLEQVVAASQLKVTTYNEDITEDEVPVYVYLYNSQGLQLKTWQNLLTPKVFYEYSVNRPIYGEKNHIDVLLRTKTNKSQHAYLTVAVKKNQILASGADSAPKDSANNPMIKVKEGSLRFEKLIAFTHLDHDYRIVNGELVKKNF